MIKIHKVIFKLEKLFLFLGDMEMKTPMPWGWFHLFWIGLSAVSIFAFLYAKRKGKRINENAIFAFYGFGSFLLELIKQLIWSVHLGEIGDVFWDYSWYSAPFQLCTMPMYVCMLLCFVRRERIRSALKSFLGFQAIINTFLVVIIPETIFCEDILINIHTMFLHCGGFVVSLLVLLGRWVSFNFKSFIGGYAVFLLFVAMALGMDIGLMDCGIVDTEDAFNMFYISPYLDCPLPVLSVVRDNTPYPMFLGIYLSSFFGLGIVLNRLTAKIAGNEKHRRNQIKNSFRTNIIYYNIITKKIITKKEKP